MPDFQTAKLTIKDGLVKIDNGGNALALGFCAIDECESLCRSYFFGKEKMFPHVFSNIIEDFVRLIMMILFILNWNKIM